MYNFNAKCMLPGTVFFSSHALKFISHRVYLSVDLINTLFSFILAQLFRFTYGLTVELDGETGAKNSSIFFTYWKRSESSCKVHLFYIFLRELFNLQIAAWIAKESANRLNAPDRRDS